jgi:hypothetical protein
MYVILFACIHPKVQQQPQQPQQQGLIMSTGGVIGTSTDH